jgi:hypothetical protein
VAGQCVRLTCTLGAGKLKSTVSVSSIIGDIYAVDCLARRLQYVHGVRTSNHLRSVAALTERLGRSDHIPITRFGKSCLSASPPTPH